MVYWYKGTLLSNKKGGNPDTHHMGVSPEDMMLSHINQPQKGMCCMIPLIQGTKGVTATETASRWWLWGAGEGGFWGGRVEWEESLSLRRRGSSGGRRK